MGIPTIPAGHNKYFDLGPTRQFDVDIIRKALLQYERAVSKELEVEQQDSAERFRLVAERLAAQELAAKFSKKLPFYE